MKDLLVENADWSRDKDALVELRTRVFVDEQKVPASLEVDGLDPECKHVKASADGLLVGTGRLLPDGHIGRMCVHRDYRVYGIGGLLLQNLITQALNAQYTEIALNAQISAIKFYQKHGFVIDSEEFLDAGILHRRMVLDKSKYNIK